MERFELNTVIDRPIEEVFAVLSSLENDLVLGIKSIYDDASMIPLCSKKRNSLRQILLDGYSWTHLCLQTGRQFILRCTCYKLQTKKTYRF